jgi:hypothetical protein
MKPKRFYLPLVMREYPRSIERKLKAEKKGQKRVFCPQE